jgi:hypothetical protein
MKIKYYWDKSWRVWVITLHDDEGNQVGDAEYAPNKTTRDTIILERTTWLT